LRERLMAAMSHHDANSDSGREALRALTAKLVACREHPGADLAMFRSTRKRTIPMPLHGSHVCSGRVIVTGGSGCVGQAMLGGLRDAGAARLVSLARHPPSRARRVPDVEYRCADVRDGEAIARVFREVRPEVVVHLAAQRDPGRAEREVVRTVSTNVLGAITVLDAAGAAGVPSVAVASTGKAIRYFTRDVYAATKKLTEYVTARAAARWGYAASCARFTHVVDNSLVFARLRRWVRQQAPVQLHGPDVVFHIQSALECHQLLTISAGTATPGKANVVALKDLGWPPINLLGLALDVVDDAAVPAMIAFTGFPPGYEQDHYPGTYDPLTAGDVTPLFNALEARLARASCLNPSVDEFVMPEERYTVLDEALTVITELYLRRAGVQAIRKALEAASMALLDLTLDRGSREALERVYRLGAVSAPGAGDHWTVHARVADALARDRDLNDWCRAPVAS